MHKIFGKGIITGIEGNLVVVKFGSVERRFEYPGSLGHILNLIDDVGTPEEQRGLPPRTDEIYQQKDNIAFKCNYCDGGKDENSVGFAGICSRNNIRYNIETRKYKWCSNPECECRKYYNGLTSYLDLPDDLLPCVDSRILLDWEAYSSSGGCSREQEIERANRFRQNLAVLTTRLPGDGEQDRIIFAVFIIGNYNSVDDIRGGLFTPVDEYRLQLTLDEAKQIKFWDYHSNRKGARDVSWGTGLHRNLTDGEAAMILRDIARIKRGQKDEQHSRKIYEHYCDTHKGTKLYAYNAPR